jgi:hypothetical protein
VVTITWSVMPVKGTLGVPAMAAALVAVVPPQ